MTDALTALLPCFSRRDVLIDTNIRRMNVVVTLDPNLIPRFLELQLAAHWHK